MFPNCILAVRLLVSPSRVGACRENRRNAAWAFSNSSDKPTQSMPVLDLIAIVSGGIYRRGHTLELSLVARSVVVEEEALA